MLRAALLSLALIAAPAWADPPEEEPTAAPGSIAIGMIESADAEGVFELVHDGQVTVRHIGSGLTCRFARNGDGGNIALFPGLPRGDDVACEMNDGAERSTFYATRYAQLIPLDDLIRGVEAAMRRVFVDARPYASTTALNVEGLPPSRTLELTFTRDGVRYFTYASVAQVGPWTIELRYSRPVADDADARQAELTADLLFAGALNDIIRARET